MLGALMARGDADSSARGQERDKEMISPDPYGVVVRSRRIRYQ
jgi:hypothetical protein